MTLTLEAFTAAHVLSQRKLRDEGMPSWWSPRSSDVAAELNRAGVACTYVEVRDFARRVGASLSDV